MELDFFAESRHYVIPERAGIQRGNGREKLCIVLVSMVLMIFVLPSWGKLAPTAPQIPPTVVDAVTVQQKNLQDTVQSTGTLAAMNGVDLSSEVAGRITQVFFQSGQMVQKGDKLIQLYSDIAQADLDRQKAQLQLEQDNYQRYLQLYKKQFVDKADLEAKKASLTSQQAYVASLQAALEQTTIRAPFSGKIGLKTISIGQYVNPGEKLVTLQALDPIRVDFSVPETYLAKLSVGDAITITSPAFTETYTGKVFALNAVINQNTRSLDVQASIPNTKLNLIPGMFVEVHLQIGTENSSLVIPQTAVTYAPESAYVYRIVNHTAVKTNIILGKQLEQSMIIVTQGLKAGDQIVNGGQMKLQYMPPNAPVILQSEMHA